MKNLLHFKSKVQKNLQQEDQNPPQNPSPNLLNYRLDHENLIAANQKQVNTFLKYPIYGLQILFVLFIVLNFYINNQLQVSEASVKKLEAELNEQSATYDKARVISLQIEKYKNIESSRVLFNERTEAVISRIPPNVIVRDASVGTTDAIGNFRITLDLETENALSVALVINEFLKVSEIDQVILSSAVYDPSQGSFMVKLILELI